MACTQCGCEQAGGAQFCRQCGAPITGRAGGSPPQPWQGYSAGTPAQQRRVAENLQPLAIVWYVLGAYRIVTGLLGAVALHTMAAGGWFARGDAPPFLPELFSSLVPVVFTVSVCMGLLAILTGYGLLSRRPWARTLAIVMGILALFKFPIGTGVGIYTLWVLAPAASGQAWQGIQAPE